MKYSPLRRTQEIRQRHPALPRAIQPLESRLLMSFAAQVVGYLPDYESANYSKINFSDVTHINYFALLATSSGGLPSTSSSGHSFSLMQSVVTRAHAAGVTVSITIDPGTPFQAIADSPAATNNFVTNIMAFCNTYHLDGIDLDYEPGTLTTTQKNSYGNLLAALHAQTSAHGLTLSAAVQVSQMIVPTADIGDLDWYYVMDYDLESYASAPYNESLTYLARWANYGVPKSKLVMGVPFYGRSGSNWSNTSTETYSQILNDYVASNAGVYPPLTADTLSVNGTTWGFNGVATMQAKANYVLQKGYGGIMIWELGQDHFNSAGQYDNYSLLPAIDNVLNLSWMTASEQSSFSFDGSTLTVNSGTVTFTANASTTDPNLNVVVNNEGEVIFEAPQSLGSLSVTGGSVIFNDSNFTTTSIGSIQVSNNGRINLQTSIITLPSSANNLSHIASALQTAYQQGAWNGPGISSTLASSDPTHNISVGVFDNGSQITLRSTWVGDSNCDGIIDADDVALMQAGQLQHATTWSAGNFNYDTKINADDWMLMAIGAAYSAGKNINPLVLPTAQVNSILGNSDERSSPLDQ